MHRGASAEVHRDAGGGMHTGSMIDREYLEVQVQLYIQVQVCVQNSWQGESPDEGRASRPGPGDKWLQLD